MLIDEYESDSHYSFPIEVVRVLGSILNPNFHRLHLRLLHRPGVYSHNLFTYFTMFTAVVVERYLHCWCQGAAVRDPRWIQNQSCPHLLPRHRHRLPGCWFSRKGFQNEELTRFEGDIQVGKKLRELWEIIGRLIRNILFLLFLCV